MLPRVNNTRPHSIDNRADANRQRTYLSSIFHTSSRLTIILLADTEQLEQSFYKANDYPAPLLDPQNNSLTSSIQPPHSHSKEGHSCLCISTISSTSSDTISNCNHSVYRGNRISPISVRPADIKPPTREVHAYLNANTQLFRLLYVNQNENALLSRHRFCQISTRNHPASS